MSKLPNGVEIGTLPSGLIVGQLPNGLRFVVRPMPGSDEVAVVARVNVGFLDEVSNEDPAIDETGLAHRVEHDLFLGNTTELTKDAFENRLERARIENNASTDFERTNFFMEGPAASLDEILENMGNMLTQPLLDPKAVAAEDDPIAEEAARDLVNPGFAAYQYGLAKAARPGTRGARIMTALPAAIRAQGKDLPRRFFDAHYHGANTVVAIVGGGIQDIPNAINKLAAKFGAMRPAPASAKPAVPAAAVFPASPPAPTVFKAKFAGKNIRVLNVLYLIDRDPTVEAAAGILGIYLNRRGEGSPLRDLVDKGWVRGGGVEQETYREKLGLRFVLEISEDGETELPELLNRLYAVVGSVARNELPESVLDELRKAYHGELLEGRGFVEIGENLTDAVGSRGFDDLNAVPEAAAKLTPADVRAVAAKLGPGQANVLLVTNQASGPVDPALGTEGQVVDYASEMPGLNKAFTDGDEPLDLHSNALLHDDEVLPIREKGVSGTILPMRWSEPAAAVLEFSFTRMKTTPAQRMAADLAVLAFQLDPANERFFWDLREAGVELSFAFNPRTMSMLVTAKGPPNGAAQALGKLLEGLNKYEPSRQALDRAKESLGDHIRALAASDVARQALGLGLSVAVSGAAPNDASQLAVMDQVTLDLVKRVLAIGRKRWAVKYDFSGPWVDAALGEILPLTLTPPYKKPVLDRRHSAKLSVRLESDKLVVRQAEVERAGVARVIPVPVERYSEAHWAMAIFSRLLSKRLMQIVRTEDGLAYAVRSGFQIFADGGGALVLVGDSSRQASKVLMAYTDTLESLLAEGGIGKDELAAARDGLAADILRDVGQSGAELAYAIEHRGFSPPDAIGKIQGIGDAKRLLQIVRQLLASAHKIDAVAAGPSDPLCQRLLNPKLAQAPETRRVVESFERRMTGGPAGR